MPDLRWAVGVTTTLARRDDLLPRTLESLAGAGFKVSRIFVDGATGTHMDDHVSRFDTAVTVRWPGVGAYGNWLLSLLELYVRDPMADYFLMSQDDALYSRNTRQYVEATVRSNHAPHKMPPGPVDRANPSAYFNLFTSRENQALCPPDKTTIGYSQKTGWYRSNQLGRGAVALVFSLRAVVALLTRQAPLESPIVAPLESPIVAIAPLDTPGADVVQCSAGAPIVFPPENPAARHVYGKPMSASVPRTNIDGAVVEALVRQAGWVELVHNPGLVQHAGHKSTLGHHNMPPSPSWRGEAFDAMSLLNGGKS